MRLAGEIDETVLRGKLRQKGIEEHLMEMEKEKEKDVRKKQETEVEGTH